MLPSFADVAKIDSKIIQDCYDRTKKLYESLAKHAERDTVARGPELLKRLNAQWNRRHPKKKKPGIKKQLTA